MSSQCPYCGGLVYLNPMRVNAPPIDIPEAYTFKTGTPEGRTLLNEEAGYSNGQEIVNLNMLNMKPHELCKHHGINGIKQLSELTGRSKRTLHNWADKSPEFFEIVVLGASRKLESCRLSGRC